jgi:hypothetical protein
MNEYVPIPPSVLDALRCVERQRPMELEMCDRDNVIEFAHLFGFDWESAWLSTHPQLYFEALHTLFAPRDVPVSFTRFPR